MTARLSSLVFVIVLTAPLFASAQSFSRDGVLGCNAAQYGGSPGTTAATQGVFVPVVDAAVVLNTGVLVYKECVLKGVAVRLREHATASINSAATKTFLTGRTTVDANGNVVQQPYYPVDLDKDKLEERDRIYALLLQNGSLDGISPTMREEIKRAIARGYYQSTRKPGQALACPYADLENALNGTPKSVREALRYLQDPACTPLGAYQLANTQIANAGNAAVENMLTKLNWSGGVYDVSTIDAQGNRITQTPGRFVASSQEQVLQSGYRQAEAADDIDEMVNALFAGLSTEIIRSNRGLAGLAQPIGNQPSYLDQMTSAAAQGLRTAVNNAAIAILRDAQLVEKAYGDVMRAILSQMLSTQNNFKEAERQCWANIIQRTCSSGSLKADGTCTSATETCTTDADGTRTCSLSNQLKIATSTIYSQAAVSGSVEFNQVATVEKNVQASDNALKLFASLIESVSGSTSQNTQLQAQLQLDSLIAQGLIHRQKDVDQAIAAKKAIDTAIAQNGTLVNQVKASWNGDASDGTEGVVPWNGTYPPKTAADIIGWCNYKNETTIQNWAAKWKK